MTYKVAVTSVTTGFSEAMALNERTFNSVYEFDAEVLKVTAGHPVTDLSYFKTDVTVTWEDGYTVDLRVDANRTNNLATAFQGRFRFYCGHAAKRPEWMTVKQWHEAREDYENFFNTYDLS